MFCGTLRENVDPLRVYSDAAVRDALEMAGLKGRALDAEVGISGNGWSIGERQLVGLTRQPCLLCALPQLLMQVCLARVLLKKPSVLFLDEATASLDAKTESHFQKVLETKFVDATIFCIAHRLETLRWCRTRVEMGKGKLLSITTLPASHSDIQ
jgi:ATP-binding cassette subfamily C (CFTR/MRP) protein 1